MFYKIWKLYSCMFINLLIIYILRMLFLILHETVLGSWAMLNYCKYAPQPLPHPIPHI